MYAPFKFVSKEVAGKIAAIVSQEIGGITSPDRVLILSPKDQDVKSGGIIIPGTAREDIPNKGVMILGYITKDNIEDYTHLQCGKVVTYGMYAGKEIDFNPELFKDLGVDFTQHKFTVLSLSEIIFIENNPNK